MASQVSHQPRRSLRMYVGFMVLLFLFGVALIWIGLRVLTGFPQQLFTSIGLACAPSAAIAVMFRYLLVQDVKDVTEPIENVVERAIPEQLGRILDRYHSEIEEFDMLRESGMVRCFPNREEGLADFFNRHDGRGRLTVVGCSLLGLLPDRDSEFARLVQKNPASVRFLLTHPAVAELRAQQENRRTPIGVDIIRCLRLLNDLGVPTTNVGLYIGTPTCFGIMSERLMLLDPYPYQSTAMHAPCMLIKVEPGRDSYIYGAFKVAHFSLFESNLTVQLSDLAASVDQLERNLPQYRALVGEVERLVKL